METALLKPYGEQLLASLILKREYYQATGQLTKKVLLVEGRTDQRFFEQITAENVDCISAGNFIKNTNVFLQKNVNGTSGLSTEMREKLSKVRSKDLILDLIKYIYMLPDLIQLPVESRDWPFYGLVDTDSNFKSNEDYSKYEKLFFTGTHDLETFILFTDHGVLQRIRQCTITKEEAERALYLASQLAAFRAALRALGKKFGFTQRSVSLADGTVDYSRFLYGDRIDLPLFMQYLNDNEGKPFSDTRMQTKTKQMKEQMNGLLNKENRWKLSCEKFRGAFGWADDSLIWKQVNGHDVTSAIRYLNPQAAQCFHGDGKGLNRKLEVAMFLNYNYLCGSETELFQKLCESGLIIDLSVPFGSDDAPAEFLPSWDALEEKELETAAMEEDDIEEESPEKEDRPEAQIEKDDVLPPKKDMRGGKPKEKHKKRNTYEED